MNTRTFAFVLAFIPALAACETDTEPRGQRVVGIVEWHSAAQGSVSSSLQTADGDAAVITAPDTVDAGVAFAATITTIGSNGCWREAGAETELSRNLAVVVPHDYASEDQAVCSQALVQLPRSVEIRFTQPGEAVLRVKGRKVVGGDYENATPVAVEKRIFVR